MSNLVVVNVYQLNSSGLDKERVSESVRELVEIQSCTWRVELLWATLLSGVSIGGVGVEGTRTRLVN